MKRIYLDMERCLACRSCIWACRLKHSQTRNLFSLIEEKPSPRARLKVAKYKVRPFVLQCRHCFDAYCYFACISGAIRKTASGVNIDPGKCVHCYSCLMVCPYGAIAIAEKGPTAVKCDHCEDQAVPACVSACPTQALFYGQEDEFFAVLEKRRKACTT
ncbi:MAG: 4Fe-4S dicluster domain-containing protein [Candidatus Omnitrophica bacterium]|nr:4Fe-4S dicluster domain-containing protein [Candidatus Omnitrophota bacterium]